MEGATISVHTELAVEDEGSPSLCVSPHQVSMEDAGVHSLCPKPGVSSGACRGTFVCSQRPESAVEHGGSPSLGPHTQSQQRSMKGKPSLCVPQVQTQQSSMEGRIGVREGSHWWPHQAHHTSLMSVLHSHSYSEMNERKSLRL